MQYIPLTKGCCTVVDEEDYERLNRYIWFTLDYPKVRYAGRWLPRTKPRKLLRMHHAILNVSPDQLGYSVVDHEDRNGLNNQKSNLSIVTRRDNALNSDRSDTALGIYWDNVRGQYKVMELQPVKKFLCWCKTAEEALQVKGISCE